MASRTYTPREWAEKQSDAKLWRELRKEASIIRRAALVSKARRLLDEATREVERLDKRDSDAAARIASLEIQLARAEARLSTT